MSENAEQKNAESESPDIASPENEGLGGMAASDELAAALKEAEQSVDQRRAESAAVAAEGEAGHGESADKMTIELLAEELQSLKGLHETALSSQAEAEEKQLRLQAEFENFRRRNLKEKQDTFRYGHQNLVKDLLAVVDNLERAVAHGEGNEDGDFQSLLQGVEFVQKELLGVLAKHGVESIEAQGLSFDPAVHEAMAQLPCSDVAPNSVMEVLQTGYMLRDRMLRPSRVVVSKAVDGASEGHDEAQQTQGDTPREPGEEEP